ncbi:MAG: hypothetical protein ACTS3F_05770 [Phycisphaerales bacterium]
MASEKLRTAIFNQVLSTGTLSRAELKERICSTTDDPEGSDDSWGTSAIDKAVKEMIDEGILNEGLTVVASRRRGTRKIYIFIELDPPEKHSKVVNYQFGVAKEIREEFQKDKQIAVTLIAVEVMLGAVHDICVVLLASDSLFDQTGDFIIQKLRAVPYVRRTRTVFCLNPEDRMLKSR